MFDEIVLQSLLEQVADEDVEVERELDDEVVLTDGREYLVVDDRGRLEHAANSIYETFGYFNPSFIESATGLPSVLFTGEQSFTADDVDRILSSVGSDIESFTQEAVDADGYGHFLAGYDGMELELENGYYAYRRN